MPKDGLRASEAVMYQPAEQSYVLRASELKREGKLIAEKGTYVLSGAGIQWVRSEIIPNLRKMVIQSPA